MGGLLEPIALSVSFRLPCFPLTQELSPGSVVKKVIGFRKKICPFFWVRCPQVVSFETIFGGGASWFPSPVSKTKEALFP